MSLGLTLRKSLKGGRGWPPSSPFPKTHSCMKAYDCCRKVSYTVVYSPRPGIISCVCVVAGYVCTEKLSARRRCDGHVMRGRREIAALTAMEVHRHRAR